MARERKDVAGAEKRGHSHVFQRTENTLNDGNPCSGSHHNHNSNSSRGSTTGSSVASACSTTTGSSQVTTAVPSHNSNIANSKNNRSSSSNRKPEKYKSKLKTSAKSPNLFSYAQRLLFDHWKTLLGCVCLTVASYFGYLGYLETRVNTPFDNERLVSGEGGPEKDWGTYRPLNYFGLKTRHPHSPVMGLMWYRPVNLGYGGQGLRHWCDMNDKLEKYGWQYHDGKHFGSQEIYDGQFQLRTSFIKYNKHKVMGENSELNDKSENNLDWTARISVLSNTSGDGHRQIALIWYVALDERTNGRLRYTAPKQDSSPGLGMAVKGVTDQLGKFRLHFHNIRGRVQHHSYLSTVAPGLNRLKETVYNHFKVINDPKGSGERFIGLAGEIVGSTQEQHLNMEPNFIAVQFLAEANFTLDITYERVGENSSPSTILVGKDYTAALRQKMSEFDARFEKTYQLSAKGFSREQILFAKWSLSSLLGGIGYFYGSSKVQSVHTSNPVPYWKAPLFTAVPSRSFFPRGFLWDEGFHGLLIATWDVDLELNILAHWLDLLNVEGWIPREQILGVEALSKVPSEFVVQNNLNGNPPTFFLVLKRLLDQQRSTLFQSERLDFLEKIYPRLQAWFAWYNSTQKGVGTSGSAYASSSYRWYGRDGNSDRELNPKTLTSGLDDYPRASHPTIEERHLDIRCWIAFASNVMGDISTMLGKNYLKYYETSSYLMDNQLLNEEHLSPLTQTYADWGLHTDAVTLKRIQKTPPMPKNIVGKRLQQPQEQTSEVLRVVLKPPTYRFVDSTFGYVNLFPFLLEILDHDSIYLGKILENIHNPQVLWTDYGLRSLSRSSPLYQKRNTEHDPPYWRGAIWININYLTLKALYHYGQVDGPYTELSRSIYTELRNNIIENIFREYQRTGYLWEQYDDNTGHGKGCHPFTGWTSLIVLIMAEQY